MFHYSDALWLYIEYISILLSVSNIEQYYYSVSLKFLRLIKKQQPKRLVIVPSKRE